MRLVAKKTFLGMSTRLWIRVRKAAIASDAAELA
jgi:hypothetical protein